MSYVNILELEKKQDKRIVLLPKPCTNILSIREDTVLALWQGGHLLQVLGRQTLIALIIQGKQWRLKK